MRERIRRDRGADRLLETLTTWSLLSAGMRGLCLRDDIGVNRDAARENMDARRTHSRATRSTRLAREWATATRSQKLTTSVTWGLGILPGVRAVAVVRAPVRGESRVKALVAHTAALEVVAVSAGARRIVPNVRSILTFWT